MHIIFFSFNIIGVTSTSWFGGLDSGKDKIVEYAKHVRKSAKLGGLGVPPRLNMKINFRGIYHDWHSKLLLRSWICR